METFSDPSSRLEASEDFAESEIYWDGEFSFSLPGKKIKTSPQPFFQGHKDFRFWAPATYVAAINFNSSRLAVDKSIGSRAPPSREEQIFALVGGEKLIEAAY